MVEVKNTSEHSLTEEFFVIFKLFQLIGIDVMNAGKVNEERRRKYGFLHRISSYSKIIVFAIQSIEIFITISWLLFSIDKLNHLIHIFLGISLTSFYVSLCKRRRAVLHVTERINHIYEMVPECSFRGKKYPFIAIFVIMQILAVAWINLRWCMITTSTSKMVNDKLKILINTHYEHLAHFVTFLLAIEYIFYFITFTALSLFVVYYSLSCKVIRILIEHLLNELQVDCLSEKSDNLIQVYGEISKCVSVMDDEFSFSAFLTVFLSMIVMFWRIYRLTLKATASNTYILSLTCSTISFTILLLLILISASLTNETSSKTKNFMKNVPYRIPKGSERIKYMLRKNSVQEYSLTLWKIYIIDRSLIITCFGTLLTYGMLIEALGKQL
ncbi:uncharacterized protein TNIN_266971 [Trichonephila inaurata madagascariensis]|uniref:Gustatory receptor n=1 Tax=Trichonephila inaurata madagascariensis TaxID=2747483 RepID=A0A8X7CAQ5_9ARAC|nr:uncharacterized protein TNIN_266971 [Trichonephila inaurata madagascariensis]